MKKSKLFIVGLMVACSMLAITPAKASTSNSSQDSSGLLGILDSWLSSIFSSSGSSSGSTSSSSGSSSGSTSSSLPIDNNVWFLIVAGGALGCKVMLDKSKQSPIAQSHEM